MTGIDYYRILGVPPSATQRAIREAYLDLARRLHPDRVGPQGTALFQQITEAYECLSDPQKRRAYDRACSCATTRAPCSEHVGFGGIAEPLVSAPRSTVDGIDWPESTLESLLYSLFGKGEIAKRSEIAEESLEFAVILTQQEASHGIVLPLGIPVIEWCEWCSGPGGAAYHCARCGGTGKVVRERVFRIRIPPPVRDGSVIEIPLDARRAGGAVLRLHLSVPSQTNLW